MRHRQTALILAMASLLGGTALPPLVLAQEADAPAAAEPAPPAATPKAAKPKPRHKQAPVTAGEGAGPVPGAVSDPSALPHKPKPHPKVEGDLQPDARERGASDHAGPTPAERRARVRAKADAEAARARGPAGGGDGPKPVVGKAVPAPSPTAPSPIVLRVPSNLSLASGQDVAIAFQAVGGAPGETLGSWTAEGLPPGLSIDGGGVLRGRATGASHGDVAIRARSSTGRDLTASLVLSVSAPAVMTAPAGVSSTLAPVQDVDVPLGKPYRSAASLATPLGFIAQPVVVRAIGQLPPGLGIDPDGHLFGAASVAGAYRIALDVVEGGTIKLRSNVFAVTVR